MSCEGRDAEGHRTSKIEGATDRVGTRIADRLQGHATATVGIVGALAGFAALVVVVGLVGALFTHVIAPTSFGHHDEGTVVWLSHHRDHILDSVTSVLSKSGDTIGAISIALLVCVWLAIRKRWREIATLFGGLALELAGFLAVNTIIDRPRPSVLRLGSTPTTSSFPSGHCAAALVLYTCLAVFLCGPGGSRVKRAIAWTIAVVMPLAVGFARVYRGMHHPLDIVGGLLLGLGAVLVAFTVAAAIAHAHEYAAARVDEPDRRVEAAGVAA